MSIRVSLMLVLLLGGTAALAAEPPAIPNLVQPDERLMIGGQPDEAALRQAAAAGVKVVVNLRGENEVIDFDEAELVRELGMTYLRLPIASADDLTLENAQAFNAILAAIEDQPALLHCASGNRVGALYALRAAVYDDADTETAIEIGRAHGLRGLEDTVRERLTDNELR